MAVVVEVEEALAAHGATPGPLLAAAEGDVSGAHCPLSGAQGPASSAPLDPAPHASRRSRGSAWRPRELHVLSAHCAGDVLGTLSSGPPGSPPGSGRPRGQLPCRFPPPLRPQHHLGAAHHAIRYATLSLRLSAWASWGPQAGLPSPPPPTPVGLKLQVSSEWIMWCGPARAPRAPSVCTGSGTSLFLWGGRCF